MFTIVLQMYKDFLKKQKKRGKSFKKRRKMKGLS